MSEIEKAVYKALDDVHWNDFDPDHEGQPKEIARAIRAAIRSFAAAVAAEMGAMDGDNAFCDGVQAAAALLRERAGLGEGE